MFMDSEKRGLSVLRGKASKRLNNYCEYFFIKLNGNTKRER